MLTFTNHRLVMSFLYTTSTNVLHRAGDVDLYEAPCLFVCPYYALRVLHGAGYADLYETPCLIMCFTHNLAVFQLSMSE
jgi:hypothetical protein